MHLSALSLYHFRNFQEAHWDKFGPVNLFLGKNGAGKTSFLEALAVSCTGRSFRARSNEVMISKNHSAFMMRTIWCDDHHDQERLDIEYSRSKGLKILKDQSTSVLKRAAFSQYPLRLLTPEHIPLLSQGPSARLNFFNWGCFYLFPQFRALWSMFLRVLQHRRILLKTARNYQDMVLWDEKLDELNKKIFELRQRHVRELQERWRRDLPQCFPHYRVQVSFFPGWDITRPYREQLMDSFESDRRQHSTQLGVHRADFKMTILGHPAAQYLSRGETKALILNLGLSQLQLFFEQSGVRPILLIDEIDAELDPFYRAQMVQALNASAAQIFMTSLDNHFDQKAWTLFYLNP